MYLKTRADREIILTFMESGTPNNPWPVIKVTQKCVPSVMNTAILLTVSSYRLSMRQYSHIHNTSKFRNVIPADEKYGTPA